MAVCFNIPDNADVLLEKELLNILTTVNPEDKEEYDNKLLKPSGMSRFQGFQHIIGFGLEDYNEVYQGIYIGGHKYAKDPQTLKRLGVTHVINAAQGTKFSQIDSNEDFYRPWSIKFFGIPALDTPNYKMTPFFYETSEFIDKCLQESGKIFVHCHQGISRSATLVLAYLMIKKNMTIIDALTTVRKKRVVFPNNGFRTELCLLNNKLFHGKDTAVE